MKRKYSIYRTPATDEAGNCQAPGCTRMATWCCVRSGKVPVRTVRCAEHARRIAVLKKLKVEGL